MNKDRQHNQDSAIPVTKAMVPAPAEYGACLDQILSSRRLTNQGEFSLRLEKELAGRLRVPYVGLCANGTLALQLGLHIAGLAGKEVVTTPFSYVATLSALLWEGCTPVFADIDEETLCIDPASVSERLTPHTAGLLPVHIYGNVCDVDALSRIARDAGLRVLYDAAQSFGCEFRGRSVLDFGDCAACSFHATKVFHTVEGGGLVMHSREDRDAFALLRACGHYGDTHVRPGINAKLSELHAAMGLCLLDRVEENIKGRKKVALGYDALLPERGLRRPVPRPGLTCNYAYYPVIFDDERALPRCMEALNRENIFPRRYFYPALNTLPYLKGERQSCPAAESVARRVLCLPLYAELEEAVVERIAAIVRRSL
ncbi:MAG: DegT/DnrJ/EryC1/StrS family aminotransferase [Desulfovibrio sp.]|jgi:dTDP-4-amino-4,6-dideoxygalactose transaminase|nr:DegT/DnrJ/EryC1/StrS family aminotransferase [Desulfovibrio sp.]